MLVLFFMLGALWFSSCQGDIKNAPDVSQVEANPLFVRYEKLLLEEYPWTSQKYQQIEERYPVFTQIFFSNVLPIKGEMGKDTFVSNLNSFIQDSSVQVLIEKVDSIYGNFSKQEAEIVEALKYYKYYFPKALIPNVYTYISEFSFQKFIFEDTETDGIGLGLDMFLGNDYPYKLLDPKNPAFSEYITRRFNKDHIALKVIQTMLEERIGTPPGPTLLDRMIHNGKRLYILDHVLPMTHDSVIFEYTEDQLNWCRENELEMWAFFFDQDLFYETSGVKTNKYVDEGPDSPGMPNAAPGRTANYLGFRIVKAFMDRKDDFEMADLIGFRDSQKLLEMSKFKPNRK